MSMAKGTYNGTYLTLNRPLRFECAGTTNHTVVTEYNATYGGVYFLQSGMTNKETGGGSAGSRVVQITGYPTGVVEIDKGALNVLLSRPSGYPYTSWGGAADTAQRIQVDNSAANATAVGGIRGLYVYARQYSGGNCSNIYGAEISTDDRGTVVAGASCAVIQSLLVTQRVNSIVSTTANVALIQCNSQGTITATTAAGTAMLKIESTQPLASGARKSAIHFSTTGSGSGWTNAFSFQTATGLEGFTAIADGDLKGKVNGYIKVFDVATNQTLYICCYDTVPST